MDSSKDSFTGGTFFNVWHSSEWKKKNRMPIKLNCKNYLANFSLAFLIICSFDNRRNINTVSLNWCLKFIGLVIIFI